MLDVDNGEIWLTLHIVDKLPYKNKLRNNQTLWNVCDPQSNYRRRGRPVGHVQTIALMS